MRCTRIDLGNGDWAIVCQPTPRRVRCSGCSDLVEAHVLCDYPLSGAREGATCDRKLCQRCALRVGDDRDLCRPHVRASLAAASGASDAAVKLGLEAARRFYADHRADPVSVAALAISLRDAALEDQSRGVVDRLGPALFRRIEAAR